MSFDAFCYSPTHKAELLGETQDKDMRANNAFEILSFELGAENNINIGSITAGGSAGKATFKEFTLTKKTDTSSCLLFNHLVTGKHFKDMVIELRRASGDGKTSGKTFMKFELFLVMVQDISWSGSDGDDVPEETIIIQFGAIKITYIPQKDNGEMNTGAKKETMWSRVLNQATTEVT